MQTHFHMFLMSSCFYSKTQKHIHYIIETCITKSFFSDNFIPPKQFFIYKSSLNCLIVTDWCLEIVADRRSGYKRYRLARKQSYSSPGCTGKISFKNHLLGRTSVYQFSSSRSCHRKMFNG